MNHLYIIPLFEILTTIVTPIISITERLHKIANNNLKTPLISSKSFTILVSGDYDLEKYESSSNYTIDQSSMDERIEKIYLEELENTTISKFQIAGIEVEKCNVDAVLDTNKKNAGIHLITVKINGPVEHEKIDSVVKELVQEYEISENKVKIIIR